MRYAICLLALLALTACESEKVEVLKSPCVGTDESPCGPKRPANPWMGQTVPSQA